MRRKALLVALFAAPLVAACGSSEGAHVAAAHDVPAPSASSSTARGPVVGLKLLQFMPRTITVKAGTTVVWTNDEPITHTVTSGKVTGVDESTGLRSGEKPDGRFDIRLAKKGDTGSYTFRTPGTYPYYCDIHHGMNARVIVTG